MTKRFITVIDNFYPDPHLIRQVALSLPFAAREYATGCRTPTYHPKGIKKRIERVIKPRIPEWMNESDESEYDSGAFYSAFSSGKYREDIRVHYDYPPSWITLLIYMSPNAPLDAGTSIWRHRETGLISNPIRSDAERLKTSVNELEEILSRDAQKTKSWEEIDRIGNVFNRAVIFTSSILHSASRHFGSNPFSGRIFQAFRFPVAWKQN